MANIFGIPEEELSKIRVRDKRCVYCHKKMIPYDKSKHRDSATIEYLNEKPPFHWKDGLKIDDIVMCCGSCNSSRGKKNLLDWVKTEYCRTRNINENTVADPVKKYLNRKDLKK